MDTNNNPNDWMRWTDYWAQYPQFFPTRHVATHFIQIRKAALIEAGILREAVKGYLVNSTELDKILVDLVAGVK